MVEIKVLMPHGHFSLLKYLISVRITRTLVSMGSFSVDFIIRISLKHGDLEA